MIPAKLTFWSGVGTVTGANFLIEFNNKKILVDCGLVQGGKDDMRWNRKPFGYNPSEIDTLFVTHAHLDHVGRIPKLVKEGFKGTIYSTPETKALAELILEDAVNILEKDAREDGVLPMYEEQDIANAMNLWKTISYHTETNLGDFSVYLKDAGHILGSSMIIFSYNGKKIAFTGDLGNSPTPLLPDTERIEDADYMVMESVYGDRNHEPKEMRKKRLEEIIKETIKRGGTLIIPAFSLERTQVILYELNQLIEEKTVPSVPVYVDSPLATKITEIYKSSYSLFNEDIREGIEKGDDPFDFPRLQYTASGEASRAIDHSRVPKIIIAGSGMSIGGRVVHHEEIYLPDPKSTILLVGYQTMGSLGRNLQNGAKSVTIGDKKIKVKAKIETILGYSSHKDSDHLVEFAYFGKDSLKEIFVAMGEPKASTFLAQRIRDEAEINAFVPEIGETYILD